MKSKSFYEQLRAEFMDGNNAEYCAYCSEERCGMSCCGESDWVQFKDLDKQSQDAIINQEFDKVYEKVDK